MGLSSTAEPPGAPCCSTTARWALQQATAGSSAAGGCSSDSLPLDHDACQTLTAACPCLPVCRLSAALLLQVELTAVQERIAHALREVADVYAAHAELDILSALRPSCSVGHLSFEWGLAQQRAVAPLPPPQRQQQQTQGAAAPAHVDVVSTAVEPLPSPAGSAGLPGDAATPEATANTRAVTSECRADSPSCSTGSP
jgi:hypothetical protein